MLSELIAHPVYIFCVFSVFAWGDLEYVFLVILFALLHVQFLMCSRIPTSSLNNFNFETLASFVLFWIAKPVTSPTRMYCTQAVWFCTSLFTSVFSVLCSSRQHLPQLQVVWINVFFRVMKRTNLPKLFCRGFLLFLFIILTLRILRRN